MLCITEIFEACRKVSAKSVFAGRKEDENRRKPFNPAARGMMLMALRINSEPSAPAPAIKAS